MPEGTPECGTTVTTPVKWFRLEGEGKKVVAKTIEPTNFDTKLVVYTKDDLQRKYDYLLRYCRSVFSLLPFFVNTAFL